MLTNIHVRSLDSLAFILHDALFWEECILSQGMSVLFHSLWFSLCVSLDRVSSDLNSFFFVFFFFFFSVSLLVNLPTSEFSTFITFCRQQYEMWLKMEYVQCWLKKNNIFNKNSENKNMPLNMLFSLKRIWNYWNTFFSFYDKKQKKGYKCLRNVHMRTHSLKLRKAKLSVIPLYSDATTT